MITSFFEVVHFLNLELFLLPHVQVNASLITKITSWLKFFGKNLHLVGCATVCGKSEVMLLEIQVALGQINLFCWPLTQNMTSYLSRFTEIVLKFMTQEQFV